MKQLECEEGEPNRAERIKVLLSEYQACHMERDHYDNLIWLVGSVLVASSLALISASFLEGIRCRFFSVILLAFTSLALMFVWCLHMSHWNHYVLWSILQLHQIEEKLCWLCFDVKLHYQIYKKTQSLRLKGRMLGLSILLIVLIAWISRLVILFFETNVVRCHWLISLGFGGTVGAVAVILLCFYWHATENKDFRSELEDTIKNRDECEKKKKKNEQED